MTRVILLPVTMGVYVPSSTVTDYNERLIGITGFTKESAVPDDFDRADNAAPEPEEEIYDEDNP